MRLLCAALLAAITGWGVPACFAQDWIYSTRPGDNIWDLTEKYAKSLGYVEAIRKLNNIEAPKRLKPGTQLRFPVRWLKIQPASARVAQVAGTAGITRPGATGPALLSAGDRLHFGDVVETSEDGNLVVEFADGSTLAVRANARVEMDRLSAYGDTGMVDSRIRLQRGRINIRATPSAGPGTRFRIHTPAAVSTVRGTRFRVAVDAENDTTRTEVTQGVVNVHSAQQTRWIPENFGIVAKVEQALAKPVQLLPRADVSALPGLIERVPVKLDWNNIDGAQKYRVQVAESGDFDTLLVDREVASSAVAFDVAVDGDYYLLLRGIDADGLEGMDANHRFVLNAYPAPPISVKPTPAETVRVAQPEFQWTAPQNARAYVFQLAPNAVFSEPIVDTRLTGDTGFKPGEPLAPGRYFWRLATQDQSGETGPFGDVMSFTYAPPQPAPDMSATPPAISKEQISFRWPEGLKGSSYHVQLARGKDFDKIIVDEIVNVPAYTFAKPKAGYYNIRIATIEADGFVGAFSDPQTLKVPHSGGWWIPLGIWALLVLII